MNVESNRGGETDRLAAWLKLAAERGPSQWCVRCERGWLRPESHGVCGVCRKEMAELAAAEPAATEVRPDRSSGALPMDEQYRIVVDIGSDGSVKLNGMENLEAWAAHYGLRFTVRVGVEFTGKGAKATGEWVDEMPKMTDEELLKLSQAAQLVYSNRIARKPVRFMKPSDPEQFPSEEMIAMADARRAIAIQRIMDRDDGGHAVYIKPDLGGEG